MIEIANLPADDRRELFHNTAAKIGLHDAIVEKDFWVCLTLDYLFHRSPWKEAVTFKGGTSLSKGYHLISRFSEDIDLILDWRVLGYGIDEPWEKRSNTKQDASTLQVIRLEIGALAAWTPAELVDIVPYAAEQYPQLFKQKEVSVLTVAPERTFWEKVTILHHEANRPEHLSMPERYSRHYYDLYCMAKSPVKEKSICAAGSAIITVSGAYSDLQALVKVSIYIFQTMLTLSLVA